MRLQLFTITAMLISSAVARQGCAWDSTHICMYGLPKSRLPNLLYSSADEALRYMLTQTRGIYTDIHKDIEQFTET